MTRALVTYASKMGSTKEIADAISGRLTERGIATDVRPAETVGTVDGYDAVVVGSAVYAGRWRPEAARFVRRFRQQLAAREVWLFESGWVGTRPRGLVATPGARRRAGRIGAPAPTVFGGRLDPELATGPLDRALAKGMPGDARDWAEIRSWSDGVADALAAGQERVRKDGGR